MIPPVVNREDIDWAELRTAAVAIGIRKAPRQAALDHVASRVVNANHGVMWKRE